MTDTYGYLGEFPVDIAETEFADYTPIDWAMYFIQEYGGIDGDHHKAWVLDQVARILKGTPVVLVEARWENHDPEYRVTTGEPSVEYLAWVEDLGGADGGYDAGIAP